MAEDGNEEVKKEGKGLLIVLIALVVILLLAVVGGGYFLYSQGVFDKQGDTAQKNQVEQVAQSTDSFKTELKDLVLNITSSKGKGKLMKLSFAIKSSEPTIEALVEENKAEIIDSVIAQISSRNSEELMTVGGKKLLKEELITEINTILDEATKGKEDIQRGSVKSILFTSFVIK